MSFIESITFRTLYFLSNLVPLRKSRRRLRKACKARLKSTVSTRGILNIAQPARLRLEELYESKENIEILAIGSSHCAAGFDPSVFNKNAFNLGLSSCDLFISLQLYRRFAEELPKLKQIVFFFSVFSPGFNLAKTHDAWFAVVYSEIFGIPLRDEPGSISERRSATERIRKTCREAQVNEEDRAKFHLGFCGNTEARKVFAEERTPYHLRENRRVPNQLEFFREFLDSVKKSKMDALIVIPPARKDYRELLPATGELFSLPELEDSAVRVANFFEDPDFTDADFSDPDHLNVVGAKKLSLKIKEILTH